MTGLKRAEQWALVAKLVDEMKEKGQWAGETHIQKALYFLKSMTKVPCMYDFVLYKHGPYSFDLHDDLGKMRAHLVLDIEARRPYGPSFSLGQVGEKSIKRVEEAINRHVSQIDFVVEHLGSMDVRTLERYATALYVKSEKNDPDIKSLGRAIVDRKPHISEEDAKSAVEWVNDLEDKAKSQGLIFEQ